MAQRLTTIILAAGKGTRMKSDLPKVLHRLGEKPMLYYPIEVARKLNSDSIIVVVGYQSHLIEENFSAPDLIFVNQGEPLGTGHAVFVARPYLKGENGHVLILCGDVPLLQPATVRAFIEFHEREGAVATVMTTLVSQPGSYGRVIKDEMGRVVKIVEAKDASSDELKVREINTGIYCVESPFLYSAVGEISNINAQGEYYLTDIMAIASASGQKTAAFVVEDAAEVMGINTREELKKAETILSQREKS